MNTTATVTGVLGIVGLIIAVIVLFNENSALQGELERLRTKNGRDVAALDARLKNLETFRESVSQDVDSLGKSAATHDAGLHNLSSRLDGSEKRLEDLHDDVVEAAESVITSKVVATASDRALQAIVEGKTLLSSQEFIDHVAQGLAQSHRHALQGEAGIDANNEVVAKLLISDPEFLDRVSVGVLTSEQSR